MPSGASGANDHDGERIGGARADFVASLGRKINDARQLLALLEKDPSSKAARDELRRRLHALGAGARLLRFDVMTHALQEVLAVLDGGAQAAEPRPQDVVFVAQVLDDLPVLAWAEVPLREPATRARPEDAHESAVPMSITALVVGGQSLVDALSEGAPTPARSFECERIDDPDNALDLARAYAPDLVLVDTDMPRAAELVEALLDDPLTGPVPVVVLGTFHTPEQLARFVALGVTRTLAKPVSAELLRATCDEIVDTRDERTMRVTLGEPTLEQLADRLSDEMRRALIESVDRSARSHRVPLGEGTEVLAALWGAIARIQEIVSQKTGGAIRFGGETPEGAIALAPWLHQDMPGADRFAGRGRGAAADVQLNGRRVVVADDDPGVTWFIADLLRTAGCVVHEALDGARALDLAFQFQPELVVSDILMPGMDGFALCRALRRDVALRDTPVILLSWKEDLLQRVRELGASAAGYLRKESGSRAILARVREVLWPRARIEMRLRGGGEVRGRLDGLTPRLLLELVCVICQNARVSIRDAAHFFEVEVRAGSPRRATRTAPDGGYQSGEQALSSLLGVGAGRFVVTPSTEPIHGELTGTLFDQLVGPIALARGALGVTTGARTTAVERIVFDQEALDPYLSATPQPTRTIIERLALGTTPRQMLLAGEVSPSLLEDILSDLSARGAIQAVVGTNGVDVLTPAVHAALALLRAASDPSLSMPDARPSLSKVARTASVAKELALSSVPPATAEQTSAKSGPARDLPDELDEVPSSLEDAVMREIIGRSPDPHESRVPPSDPPPIVEPSELRRRSSNPPESDAAAQAQLSMPRSIPPGSIPPDAVVPATTTSEELAAVELNAESARAQTPRIGVPDDDHRDAPAPLKADAPEPTRARGRSGLWRVVGLLAMAVAAALLWGRFDQGSPVGPPDALIAAAPPPPSASAMRAAPSTTRGADDDLPPGAEVPPGFGLLEVTAPVRAIVRIDGVLAGPGPFVANVLMPGSHEVSVELGGRQSRNLVEVRAGRATRVGPALLP